MWSPCLLHLLEFRDLQKGCIDASMMGYLASKGEIEWSRLPCLSHTGLSDTFGLTKKGR